MHRSKYVRDYYELLNYRPRSFNSDVWKMATEIIPLTYFWKHHHEMSGSRGDSSLEPEVIAAKLLAEHLLGMTKWKSHGNGLISRKYGSEIGAVTFAIDVLGTVHERIHGDCVDPTVETHIWLHVLDWSNEPLLDETPRSADETHQIPYRLCILPSYDAASADGCLGIVMAAEGCSLREMFDLVPRSHRTVCDQLVQSKEGLDSMARRIAELYSEAQPNLFQSWDLREFERVFDSFRRMEDEEIFGIRRKFVSSENPLDENLHPRTDIWREDAIQIQKLKIPEKVLHARARKMELAISKIRKLEDMVEEFPELNKKFLSVTELLQDENWEEGFLQGNELTSQYAVLFDREQENLALESRANEIFHLARKFLDEHEILSETHGHCLREASYSLENGRFDLVHENLKPLIRRGNELDINHLVSGIL